MLRRLPVLRAATVYAANAIFRVIMLPFGRHRRRGVVREVSELIARTDTLNEAAERYYSVTDRDFVSGKPFTDEAGFSRYLFNLAVLIHGLRLQRTDVVVEFGAGSCWVSHFLNRFGCKTIAVDVAKSGLNIGEALFRRDPATNWNVRPEFLPYDGRRIPLPNGGCDRIIVFDAFHHVPNQREILTEMFRILRPDGIVAMSEPGTGHAQASTSVRD